jgi:hypothetical protein
MKIVMTLLVLTLATTAGAQKDSLYGSFEASFGTGNAADWLSNYRLNVGSRDHRVTATYYCWGAGPDLVDLDFDFDFGWQTERGARVSSSPEPDAPSTWSDPDEFALQYGRVLRIGDFAMIPSVGISWGRQVETQYFDGIRYTDTDLSWFYESTSTVEYKTRRVTHNYIGVPIAWSGELIVSRNVAFVGHMFINVIGRNRAGWSLGIGVGSY